MKKHSFELQITSANQIHANQLADFYINAKLGENRFNAK